MKAQTLLRYFLIFGVLYFAHSAFAAPQNESRELAAHTEVYKITDGYGEYAGQGSTKIQAQSGAREACVMAKITAYESRFGVTPDPDTADLMIDACINK
jgi:hypothetical protein